MGAESFFAEPGFKVGKSLRFNEADTSRLSRTFTSAGNTKKWTFSCWVKRGKIDGESHTLFATYRQGTNDFDYIRIQTDDSVYASVRDDDANYHFRIITNRKLRDLNTWYHIVVRYDSTAGTPAQPENALYINGVLEDDLAANVLPTQNDVSNINGAVTHLIGSWNANSTYYLDGYLAEVNFVDGYTLPASYFGETDTVSNQWIPIKYDGAYGNNGFYLPFKGYGIAVATGGSIATDGDYKVHSFTSNGTFEITSITNTDPTLTLAEVEYLIIGGGGAGGGNSTSANVGGAGGGGAGAYRPGSALLSAQTYAVVIGAGGTGDTYSGNPAGDQGDDSSAFSITAEGGGSGGTYGYPVTSYGDNGSGGGGQGRSDNSAHAGGTGGQFGNDGGDGHDGSVEAGQPNYGAGGGGGSSAVGADGSQTAGGAGGAGTASSITGSSVTRAGGGGGSTRNNQGTQGAAGSGGAGAAGQAQGGNASANTGAGGGGAHKSNATSTGGDGGSGIVIIRYRFQ